MSFASTAKRNSDSKFVNITEGKENIKTEELIKAFPDGITVIGFTTLLNKKKEKISAFIFKENPGVFFFGGQVMTDLAEKWAADYNGNFVDANNALLAEGGVKMKLVRKTSKAGNVYTDYEVIETEPGIPVVNPEDLPFN